MCGFFFYTRFQQDEAPWVQAESCYLQGLAGAWSAFKTSCGDQFRNLCTRQHLSHQRGGHIAILELNFTWRLWIVERIRILPSTQTLRMLCGPWWPDFRAGMAFLWRLPMQDLSVSISKLSAGVTCSPFFKAKCHPESCHLISNIYINTSLLLPAKKPARAWFFFFTSLRKCIWCIWAQEMWCT